MMQSTENEVKQCFILLPLTTVKGFNVLIGGRETLWIYGSLPINPCAHAHAPTHPHHRRVSVHTQ